ncbi:MAG: ABC transporter ATP-binding protein [Bacteriovoracaceae bacterium]
MIKVDSVTRFYGDHLAVDNLSFTVRKGSIHGFLGPNGAGKTTTMKMIAALLPPHSGKITIDSIDVAQEPMQIKKSIGILLEIPPLFLDMEVREYLEFAARLHLVAKKDVGSHVDDVLEKMNLESVERRLVGNLSKGYKQKVGVAQAIVHRPAVVILDEPTSGLDPKAVMEMRALIKDLKKEHTILFSSHLLKKPILFATM